MRAYYDRQLLGPGRVRLQPQVRQAIEACRNQEDRPTTELLQPYILGMDFRLQLTSIFSYAPEDVARRSNSTGGDSPLGNIAADSMRKRRRVEAEMALTNSLGIRDNLYAGVVTQEAMFNVFPFENTINIMYLSGVEMQEMFDFVAERSAERGCVSQAQISGAPLHHGLRPGADQRPAHRLRSGRRRRGPDCPQDGRDGHAPWQCLEDVGGSRCWAHPAIDIQINGKPLDPNGTYRIAVNDYIAKGGSGFKVLKRNTTRIETGISLRDSLIGYMQGFCTCDDINEGKETSATGQHCGTLINGQWVVDDQTRALCRQAQDFKDALDKTVGSCTCRDTLGNDGRARHLRQPPPSRIAWPPASCRRAPTRAGAAAATRWRAPTPPAAPSRRSCAASVRTPHHGDRQRDRGWPHRPEGEVMKRLLLVSALAAAGCYSADGSLSATDDNPSGVSSFKVEVKGTASVDAATERALRSPWSARAWRATATTRTRSPPRRRAPRAAPTPSPRARWPSIWPSPRSNSQGEPLHRLQRPRLLPRHSGRSHRRLRRRGGPRCKEGRARAPCRWLTSTAQSRVWVQDEPPQVDYTMEAWPDDPGTLPPSTARTATPRA